MTQELNVVIASLMGEGERESGGVFTVDWTRADVKLQDFRLADPSLFVLNMVACAVSCGAYRLELEKERSLQRIFFNGELPQPERLREIFSPVLNRAAPPAHRELALALHGASALKGSPGLRLAVGTREGFWEAEIVEGKVDLKEGGHNRRGVQLTLTYESPGRLVSLWGNPLARSTEVLAEKMLYFCRYAPMDILVNGKWMGGTSVSLGSLQQPSPFAVRFLKGVQEMRLARPGVRRRDIFSSSDRTSPLPSSLVVGLATPEVAQREGFLLISRGVTFRRPQELLGNPLACAVVTADHLEKDLSQSDLVEGEDYEALLQLVREQVEDLMAEVLVNPPGWSLEQSQAFRKVLLERYPKVPRPLEVEFFLRCQEMEVLCQSLEGAQAQLKFWREGQDHPQAGPTGERLRAVLKQNLLNQLSASRWKEGLALAELYHSLISLDNDFLKALLVLSQSSDSIPLAAELDDSWLDYLQGRVDDLDGNLVWQNFCRFERACAEEDWEVADRWAEGLRQQSRGPFLFLWLGFYYKLRGRPEVTASLWGACLKSLRPEAYGFYFDQLWPEIRGRVPLLTQIRWGALRMFYSSEGELPAEPRDWLDWSLQVWRDREAGHPSLARWHFLKTLAERGLNLQTLRFDWNRALPV